MSEVIANKLTEYDFIVAIDTSGSMGEAVRPGSAPGRTPDDLAVIRWK